MKYLSFALAFLACIGQSCTSADPDTKAPSLLLSSGTTPYAEAMICGKVSPNVFQLKSGENLDLVLYAVDDEALSQLKIEILDNHDCNGYNKRTQDWLYEEVIELEGNEGRVSKSLPVPENVTAGNYHLVLSLLDASGNEAPQQVYDVSLMNTSDIEIPELSILAPTSSSLQVQKGSSLSISATIADNEALFDGSRWKLQYKDPSSGNTFTVLEEGFDTAERSVQVSHTFEIPKTWISGSYEMVLRAYDAVNNEAEPKSFMMEVQ